MLNINGKTFMNLQEAVQWLLDNNALPFQANVNYIANTEIAKSSIINPSPASIKVGALVLFADSKIGTVSAVNSNSFMVGPQYTDIKNALNFISNVAINGSQHLIVTFSDGSTVDAGFLKQVSYFAIDASQHLIVYYNDSTSTDLGAIFSGNITISGNLTVTGSINGEASPSVKPIYYHPIYVVDYNEGVSFTCLILNNDPTPFTWLTFKAFLSSTFYFALQPINGSATINSETIILNRIVKGSDSNIYFYGLKLSDNTPYGANATTKWNALFTGDLGNTQFEDSVNKIN